MCYFEIRLSASLASRDIVSRAFFRESSAWRVLLVMFDSMDPSLTFVARSICGPSPRGAAALLRLVIQKLCKHLGQNGVDLNADIANLVNQGLSPKIQKALDVVRVIGNEAVHPGQIDLNDNPEMASKLFVLVNLIVDAMITQPKQINDLYRSLPESKRKAIDARDSATPRK